MKMTLEAVMRQEPTLTRYGFGVYKSPDKAYREKTLAEGRAELWEHAERIQDVCAWIWLHLRPIQSLNSHRSSYGLKHIVEKDIGYVANGELIAAMLMGGYRHAKHGPNAWLNVSETRVKAVTWRQAN